MTYSVCGNKKAITIKLPKNQIDWIEAVSSKLGISKSAYMEMMILEAVQAGEMEKIQFIENFLISKKIATSHNRHYMSLLFKLRKKYHKTTKEEKK